MNSIFLSYKREDEPKAGKLVAALEAEGLSVWWDRGLPGGEEWRANIERALTQAKCVIVLWTHASVGPEGGFVRDEASRAKARNILVPVRAEAVNPPLGFGEVQAVDLAHWRGSRNDPFFKDLVATVQAKLDGRDVPPAKGPAIRLYRRLRAGAGVTAIVAAIAGFGMNALGVQNQLCTMPVGQPFISDTCGTFSLGGRPSGPERRDMEQAQGNCDALRAIASNPNHHFNQDAAAVLDAAVPIRATDFTPAAPREARNYLRTAERPHPTESAARDDALARARADAEEVTCAPRQFERLDGVDLDMARSRPDCRADPRGGYVCGLDYVAQCRISEQALVERCQ